MKISPTNGIKAEWKSESKAPASGSWNTITADNGRSKSRGRYWSQQTLVAENP